MKAPQFRELLIKSIKTAPYNPAGRTAERRVDDLVDSMSIDGLYYPILVTAKYVVIDGHRRLAAAKRLGWKTIGAVITDLEPHGTYASVNSTSRKMGGNEALSVWMQEPAAVTPLLATRFKGMVGVLGFNRVKKMCKEGYSNQLYHQAVHVAKYCDRGDDHALVSDVVDWMMEHRVTSAVRQAMAAGQPSSMILSAVRRNKPLVMRLAIRD